MKVKADKTEVKTLEGQLKKNTTESKKISINVAEARKAVKRVQKLQDSPPAKPLQDAATELVIHGLPYTGKGERLDEIIQNIARRKGVTLPQDARFFRALRKGDSKQARDLGPPRVILQLRNNTTKNAMRKRNWEHGPLTLSALGYRDEKLTEPQMKAEIYLNENLSHPFSKLFYEARQFKRDNSWRFAWTKDGVTFLRKQEEEGAHAIRSMEDLNRLKAQNQAPGL